MVDISEIEDVLLPALTQEMRSCIITNSQGDIVIMHEKGTQSNVQWVEYDVSLNALSIIHDEGRLQDLGIKIDKAMQENLLHAREVVLIKAKKGKLLSHQKAVLVNKTY